MLRMFLLTAILCASFAGAARAEESPDSTAADSTAADSTSAEKPKWSVSTSDLGPSRAETWTVEEGTWMSLDVSPDGKWIVFDLLGDLYRMPIGGGEAVRLRGGRAWEMQPRYSPDGEWISFTSDAGGGDNIWVMRADTTEARQVTKEDFRLFNNAVWSDDGRYLVARKHFTSRRSLGAGEMWMVDVASGGGGVQLTKKPNDQKDVGEPEMSPDGRYLYYSIDSTPGGSFEYNKDPNRAIYTIRRLDLTTGETVTVVNVPGGSVRPTLSPDGKKLAYVRRVRLESVLVVRDLATGIDTPLYDGLSKDSQETWAIHGVYPNFSFTPDGKRIVIWSKGKILSIDAASGKLSEVPFRATIEADIVEALRFPQPIGEETFPVRAIRWPRVSPNGKQVVFQALGHLWIRDIAGGTPKRLTKGTDFEFHPEWAPDGSRIVYTTWNDRDAGRVRWARGGGSGGVLVDVPGHYVEPSVSPDGKWVVYRRAGGDEYRGNRYVQDLGIYVVPMSGGAPRLVTRDGRAPRFDASGERILLMESTDDKKTLYSVDLLGSDRRDVATSERAMEMVLSPDGAWIAFEELWDAYVAPCPPAGGAIAVGPEMKNLPVRKVSKVAGEFLSWSKDGKTLRYGLGPDLYSVPVAPLFEHADKTPEAKPDSVHLGWVAEADVPETDVALVGATILTMAEPEVIEDGVVLVRGNRIQAVGPRGSVDVGGARTIDVSGKVLLPGYVDVHAHLGSADDDVEPQQIWGYLANLAFGVTTTHDPSNNTRRVFALSELVKSGTVLGPRIFSTGTILYGAEGEFKSVTNSLEDAKRHLKRLKAYGAFSAKSYNQPRREQRQWYIAAARELEMMIVPEGGSLYHHNMSMFLDGHTTLEHAVPIAPLYDDALTLMARSKTGYTPTLIVGYGGLWGENYWYQHTDVWENERLLRFVPRSAVDPRARRRTLAPEGEFHHLTLARTAAEVERRGGNVEVGAHGQMQGLGVHWELWMMGQGGLSPLESLRVATRNGAEAVGLIEDLGTIEAGKLADLIVLDQDPREDLRNSESVGLVMVNGRLFDARTLDQIAPEARKLPPGPPLEDVPPEMLGEGCLEN